MACPLLDGEPSVNTLLHMSATAINRRPASKPAPRREIELDITGGDLFLRGRFSDWESGLSLGPDLDSVALRLAVDTTSPSSALGVSSLFAFRSRLVEPLGKGGYTAQGTFTGPAGSKPLDMLIETPLGHSALIVLSFSADKNDFGEGWHDLLQNEAGPPSPAEGEPSRLAHAWLTTPVLAAA